MRFKRTVLHRIGDTCPEDHGGGALVRVGPYLTLEYTHGAESEGIGREPEDRTAEMTLYRVDVPTIGRGLADIEAIRRELDWCDWPGISSYTGLDAWEILEIALDPSRAWALYELAASHDGWDELDLDPLRLPYWRIARRWESRARTCKACGVRYWGSICQDCARRSLNSLQNEARLRRG